MSTPYVVVLGQHEVFGEVRGEHIRNFDVQSEVRQVLELDGRTASRRKPESVSIEVFRLVVRSGKLVRQLAMRLDERLPVARLTEHEYESEMTVLLADLPESFRLFVRRQAWEDGHSSGYEEVISIAQDLASGLQPAIEQYRKSLLAGAEDRQADARPKARKAKVSG